MNIFSMDVEMELKKPAATLEKRRLIELEYKTSVSVNLEVICYLQENIHLLQLAFYILNLQLYLQQLLTSVFSLVFFNITYLSKTATINQVFFLCFGVLGFCICCFFISCQKFSSNEANVVSRVGVVTIQNLNYNYIIEPLNSNCNYNFSCEVQLQLQQESVIITIIIPQLSSKLWLKRNHQ